MSDMYIINYLRRSEQVLAARPLKRPRPILTHTPTTSRGHLATDADGHKSRYPDPFLKKSVHNWMAWPNWHAEYNKNEIVCF